MRLSVISRVWSQQAPKAGEVVEGVVVEVKNSRATLKLNGCLLQAEMDKRNAEGAEGEEGWWAERLVKVGATMKAVVLSVKELPNGRRIVKVSNVE
jgi:rRNA biogenesis protein RRP5